MLPRPVIAALAAGAAVSRRRAARAQRQRAYDDARCAEVCRELSTGGGAFMHNHPIRNYRRADP